jgi:membrane protease YdiL (CAAX protease family)
MHIGLLLVTLCGSISAVASHVQFVRVPAVGFAETSITLITFIALSCREELSFHGYPLRCSERSFGLWSAPIIVAVVFAAEHMAEG